MPQLIIEQPGVSPITVPLSGGVIRFGRADDNEIVLVAEEVSRYHAKIHLDNGKSVLGDLKSLNGTYVNRQRVVERVLAHNDEVWFGGKCRALFQDEPGLTTERPKTKDLDSALTQDLDKIREEMDQVTARMTMIGGSDMAAREAAAEKVELAKMQRAFRRLHAHYEATKLISSDFDLEGRLSKVLDLAIEVSGADRGFLMMHEKESNQVVVKVAREMGQELQASSPSMGIAQRAALEGEPVLMTDSEADSKFGGRESIIRQRILSAMCVPLSVEDRILGSLYVDTRQAGTKFAQEDLELFQAMANQSAMAIEHVQFYKKMVEAEKKRANFGRFLSPAIVEVLMNQDQELELGGQNRTVTILYCDIRGFTPLSEGLTPVALGGLLNNHFTAMTEVVFRYQGTLDKYIGDELMALFGAPFTVGNDTEQAVRAAVDMQHLNARLNERRKAEGYPPFEIGIGINTGEVFSGYIGSPDRMDFTVIGDHVNVASRLCSVARGGQILIGAPTHELIKESFDSKSIGMTTLKGKSDQTEAFEIVYDTT